jgi:uncharacterized protein (TIGR03083 family)
VDRQAYLAALESDGFALARAAERNLGAAVRSCPGWSVADLVWHMGEVHHFWEQVARRRLQHGREAEDAQRPSDDDVIEWYRAGVGRLLETLVTADPSTPVWTWAPRKDIAFIVRRMAQETAVHRWDAQAAAGPPDPIDGELAVDGIDEFLDMFLAPDGERLGDPGERIHLHAFHPEAEWLVEAGGGALHIRREHARGDAAARGTASDLLLMLWRRLSPSELDVVGDHAALERFLARADLD